MSSVASRITVIADLLLGAAYADEYFDGRERDVVRDLLAKLLDVSVVPADIAARIDAFDPGAFDLKATAADFAADPPIQKRKLLELVTAVRDADDEISLDEDDYIHALGEALGMDRAEYADLTLEIEFEDLKEKFASLRSGPPPIPKR